MILELRDRERALALAYAPAASRGALAALFALDERLADIVRSTTQPLVGQMRLTWWHEALSGLGSGTPPAEPLIAELDRLAREGLLDGAGLLPLIEGWEQLLEPLPLPDAALEAFARDRGGTLFAAAARASGAEPSTRVQAAGEGWALVDLACHVSDRATAERALALARHRLASGAWPRRLRALGVLAVLARRDARAGLGATRRQGSPGRVARALWHGVTGR